MRLAAALLTVALAVANEALARSNWASKLAGSMMARVWSFLTTLLKSAWSSLIRPET